MRVLVIGQAAFGEAVFKRLLADGLEVAGVSAPEPAEGARPDPLWAVAEQAGVPLVPTVLLKKPEGLARWEALGGDLCVMAFVTEIIPAAILAAPPLGTIQYHPSLLPLHRGSSAMNWAIINGDAETGLTIFWPDSGIDTGPILLTKTCPIAASDTVTTIYFNQLFPMGVDAIAESIALVQHSAAPRLEQDHAASTYEPACTPAHAEIRWHEPAQRISALIRGCNSQPGAWTTYQGEMLGIFDIELLGHGAPGLPGRVLEIGDTSIDIRLNGDVLRISRVQPAGGKKISAGEWAVQVGLKTGFRFR